MSSKNEFVKITKELAESYIEKIKVQGVEDDEGAHCTEDYLHQQFILGVAQGLYEKDEAIQVAKIVISSQQIEFCRWYA